MCLNWSARRGKKGVRKLLRVNQEIQSEGGETRECAKGRGKDRTGRAKQSGEWEGQVEEGIWEGITNTDDI